MVGNEGKKEGRGKGRGGKERRTVVDPGGSGDMSPLAGVTHFLLVNETVESRAI